MKVTFDLSGKLTWLYNTVYFFKKYFIILFCLGLIAAFGRTIQLGAFGQVNFWINMVLEVVVESARLIIFLFVLGLASIKNGVLRIRQLFTYKSKRKIHWALAIQNLKSQWVSILLSIIGFLIIASLINYLIDLLAYETCFYITLKKDGIIASASSEWVIILFFKNISVIPLTLIFNAIFLLWITNKFRRPGTAG